MNRLLIIIALLVLLGGVVAGPLQLSYVHSDSMEPTIEEGDGYLLIETTATDTGEIVTFWSETRDEYVTHRIVDQTDGGYITRGDNNEQTDQSMGHPIVTEEDIVGVVVTVGDTPLVIPYLELVVVFLKQYWLILIALLFLPPLVTSSIRPDGPIRAEDVFKPLFTMLLLTGTVMVTLSTITLPVTYTAVEDPNPTADLTVETGGEGVLEIPLSNFGSSPIVHTEVESDDGTVTQEERSRSTVLQLIVPRKMETGSYQTEVTVYTYPATLPSPLISYLHTIHPYAAAGGTVAALVLPVYVLTAFLIDMKAPFTPVRSRSYRQRHN